MNRLLSVTYLSCLGGVVAISLAAAVLTTAPVSAVDSASTARLEAAKTSPSTKVHTFVVRGLGDRGPGTLRTGISFANSGSRRSVTIITFKVRGVIKLSRPLPALRRTTVIDGFSAPGYSGRPVVEVNFNDQSGLFYSPGSDGSVLRGLALDDASGAGASLYASSITIVANYVGLNRFGRPFGNHGDGLYLSQRSAGNHLGANNNLVSGAVSNVISANGGNGIVLAGSGHNKIFDNRIGTNPAGTAAMGNRGDGLLMVGGARDNLIGGPVFVDSATGQANDPTGDKGTVTPVFVVPPLGNLISGNGHDGVVVANGSSRNEFNGNFVGTTADGDAGLGNAGDGIWIVRANRNSLIGCEFRNNPFVYYNVVSANRGNGLRITDSDGTTVQGNFFGIAANNTTILGNRGNGIAVEGTSANTQVGGVIPLGNAASGNFRNGIAVTGRARGFVTFNTFGGLLPFKGAAPNHHDGLLVTSTGGNNLARTNVFSGNLGNGIELGGNARGVTVDPDIVGLNTRGTGLLSNGRNGLLIDGNAHANVIGGNLRSVIHQNTFSGNKGYGVVITGRAHGNVVFGSFIGTAINGKTALGNGRGGVLIAGFAHGNVIGGRRNLISGNTGNGVTLLGGTFANRIVHNFIGLNIFRLPLPNSNHPVVDRGHANIIHGNLT